MSQRLTPTYFRQPPRVAETKRNFSRHLKILGEAALADHSLKTVFRTDLQNTLSKRRAWGSYMAKSNLNGDKIGLEHWTGLESTTPKGPLGLQGRNGANVGRAQRASRRVMLSGGWVCFFLFRLLLSMQ